MGKQEMPKKYKLDFDENGTNEVSEQISDSYNLGFIDQENWSLVNKSNSDAESGNFA